MKLGVRCISLILWVSFTALGQDDPRLPQIGGEYRGSISLQPQVSPSDAFLASILEAEQRGSKTALPREVTLPTTTIPIDIDWCLLPGAAASALPLALPEAIRKFQFCSPTQPLGVCRSVSGGGAQVKICGAITEFRTRGFIRVGGSIDTVTNVSAGKVEPGSPAVFSPCNRVPRIPDLCTYTGLCIPGLRVLVQASKPAVYYPCNSGAACIAAVCVPGLPVWYNGRYVTCSRVKDAVAAKYETCKLVKAPVLPKVILPGLERFNVNGGHTLQIQLTHTIGGNASIEMDVPMFLGVAQGFQQQIGDGKLSAQAKLGFFLHLEAEAKEAKLILDANADSRATFDVDWNPSRGWLDRSRVTANTWRAGLSFQEPKQIRLKEAIQASAELELTFTGKNAITKKEIQYFSIGAGLFTGPYLEDIWSRLPNQNFRHDIDSAFEVGAQASLKITDGGFLLPDLHLVDFNASRDLARGDVLDLYGRGDLEVSLRVTGAPPAPIHARLELVPQTTGLARHIPATPLEFRNITPGGKVRFSQHPSVRNPKALCEVDAPVLGGAPAVINCELVGGDHTLTLDVPASCSVNGGNRRRVRLVPGLVTSEQVEVTCGAGGGVEIPPPPDKPALISNPSILSFLHQVGAAPPAPRTVTVFGESTAFVAVATKYGGAAWLTVTPDRSTTPARITVSVISGALPPGDYLESVLLSNPAAPGAFVEIPVSLRVSAEALLEVSTKSLEMEAMAGATAPLSSTITVAGAPFTATALGGAWLGVTPAGGRITVTANPTGLAEGDYTGVIRISASGTRPVDVAVTLRVRPNRLAISQIADGDNWSTSIVLVNTDKEAAPFTIRFYGPGGQPLAVDLEAGPMVTEYSATIAPGGSHILETGGVEGQLTQGWAEITAERALGGRAIFRQRREDETYSEAAVPLAWPSDGRVFLPFDNTQGFATAAAILNSNSSQTATVTFIFRDENGQTIGTDTLRLGVRNREAFALAERFQFLGNRRGVAEISSTASGLSVLGLRFNPRGSFTSFEAVKPLTNTSGVLSRAISQIADGDSWKTTFVLANNGPEPASFSLSFRTPTGAALALPIAGLGTKTEISGVIPAGGSRTIETDGNAGVLLQGWAEIVTPQSIGGTTVFRQRRPDGSDSEAAVQISPGAGSSFVLPFDNTDGIVTAVAALNDTNSTATASIVFRNEEGQAISTETLTIAADNRTAFSLPLQYPKTAGQRGVAEFSAPGVTILGLRFNPLGSFTSFDPVRK